VRELQALEVSLCRLLEAEPHALARPDASDLRYALSLARVSAVALGQGPGAAVVEVGHATDAYRGRLFEVIQPVLGGERVVRAGLADAVVRARLLAAQERRALLRLYGPRLTPEALDGAVRQRPLALVLGGGGGTSYVFVGAMFMLHEAGLTPDLISGASMGAILGAFRARQRDFPLERVRKVVAELSFRKVFRLFDTQSRFGMPATLKLYLRAAVAEHFTEDGRVLGMQDMAIPLRIMVGGLHDVTHPERYAHLLDGIEHVRSLAGRTAEIARALAELAGAPAKPVTVGADELTRTFDVVDAMGFSAAVPGVIHYDVLRDDPRMFALLTQLLERERVARLVDGGVADNLPSRAAWDAIQQGAVGARDPFVLALDSFEPRFTFGPNLLFYPLMQLAQENSRVGRRLASYVVSFKNVLSPLAVVPTPDQMDWAIEAGRREFAPHLNVIRRVLEPIHPTSAITHMAAHSAG